MKAPFDSEKGSDIMLNIQNVMDSDSSFKDDDELYKLVDDDLVDVGENVNDNKNEGL